MEHTNAIKVQIGDFLRIPHDYRMYKVLDVINEDPDDVPLPLFHCEDTEGKVRDITYKHFMVTTKRFTEQDYMDLMGS